MMPSRLSGLFSRSVPVALLLLASLPAIAQTKPANSTQKSDKPAEKSLDGAMTVKLGTLSQRFEVDGYLEPAEKIELTLRLRSYRGELLVKQAILPGQRVSRGDLVLELDTTQIKKDLVSAENQLTLALAELERTQAEQALNVQSDEQALARGKRELANADAQADFWWKKVDRVLSVTQIELMKKIYKYQKESAEVKLAELQKLYRSEQLTHETADQAIKEAQMMVDYYGQVMAMMELNARKTLDFEVENRAKGLQDSLESVRMSLENLKLRQAEQVVRRKITLETAQRSVDEARRKVEDLRKDLELFRMEAPSGGILVYGAFENGAWLNRTQRPMLARDSVSTNQVLMTIFKPGELAARFSLAEAKLLWLKAGQRVTVVPKSLTDTIYSGTCREPRWLNAEGGSETRVEIPVELPETDTRLRPGFHAQIRIDLGDLEKVLVVPTAAVSQGRVWVVKEGKSEPREVVLGRFDSKQIQILKGLQEGDQILSQAKN